MEISERERKMRTRLVLASGALFSVILVSLFYLNVTPLEAATLALSYTAGVSMIFLP
jgi:hypothetical protein